MYELYVLMLKYERHLKFEKYQLNTYSYDQFENHKNVLHPTKLSGVRK